MTKHHYCRSCKKEFIPYQSNLNKGYSLYCNMSCYNMDRGKNPGYYAVHKWLKKHFGKADFCEGENCLGISNNYQWCLKHNCNYIKDRECFLKLCVSCHRKYDFTKEKGQIISDFMKTRVTTKETREKMSKSRIGKKLSKEWCQNISKGQKKRWSLGKDKI